ncbi:MAG: succinylglutamate desuccinylase/aspartoacylase family protein [Acidobacteriota bacterium]
MYIETIFDFSQLDLDRPGKSYYRLSFAHDGDWASILVPLIVINGGRGSGRGMVVFGGTHGNEYEGQVAALRLAHELDPKEMSGRVILMPRLNPPACSAATRESPLDRGNMNRAFPGKPDGTITYRIADFVTRFIFPRVEIVVDIHAGGTKLRFPVLPAVLETTNEEVWQESVNAAFLFDAPYIGVGNASLQPGTLTGYATGLGKITIGGEFGYCKSVFLAGVRHAFGGILNLLHHYGNLPGQPKRIDPARKTPPRLIRAASAEEYVPAPFSGVFEPVVEVGESVNGGQLLGRLYNFERFSQPAFEIRAHHAGFVMMLVFEGPVQQGDWIYVIGQEMPPPSPAVRSLWNNMMSQ